MLTLPRPEGNLPEALKLPAVIPTVVGLHGTIIPFVATQEEWDEYAEQLEHYYTANDVTSEGKHRTILLKCIGPTTYVSTYQDTGISHEGN